MPTRKHKITVLMWQQQDILLEKGIFDHIEFFIIFFVFLTKALHLWMTITLNFVLHSTFSKAQKKKRKKISYFNRRLFASSLYLCLLFLLISVINLEKSLIFFFHWKNNIKLRAQALHLCFNFVAKRKEWVFNAYNFQCPLSWNLILSY